MAATLLDIDTKLAKAARFIIGAAGEGKKQTEILFQFPPKVLTDTRAGTWEEAELPGDQPVSVFKTSGARKLTLEWTYIIGANGWNTQKVRDQILNLRNYYTKGADTIVEGLIVYLKIWKLGGTEDLTFRLSNIDISHGKALYIADGDVLTAHPVITNVKIGMQPWIKGGPSSSLDSKKYPKMDIKPLDFSVPIDWQ